MGTIFNGGQDDVGFYGGGGSITGVERGGWGYLTNGEPSLQASSPSAGGSQPTTPALVPKVICAGRRNYR